MCGKIMKKTQRKDAVRNILRQKVAWLSMVLVILVGITGMMLPVCIDSSVKKSAGSFYDETCFRDLEITHATGLSDESVRLLSADESVRDAEGFHSVSAMMFQSHDPSVGEERTEAKENGERAEETDSPPVWNVHIHSNTERISRPVLADGKLPENEAECALDEALAQKAGLTIGDWIELTGNNSFGIRLNSVCFQITGLIQHPHAVIRSKADTVLLAKGAFTESFGYTGVLIRLNLPDRISADPLSDVYLTQSDRAAERLQPVLREVSEARIREIRSMLKSDAALEEALQTRGLTLQALEEWIASPNPSWETADPQIQESRDDLESLMEAMNTDLSSLHIAYSGVTASGAVIQDRRMNESYEYLRSMHQTVSRLAVFFAPLFALVAGIVFFSSTLILISDQRHQVGAMKAMGFRDGVIRKKYAVFGASAALAGAAGGVLLARFVSGRVLRIWDEQFSIGGLVLSFPPAAAALIGISVLLAMLLVVYAACARLLKCSATGLLQGSEPRRKTHEKTRKKARKHSLYSELILNNTRNEKARAVTTVIIIAISVLLIGMSITVRQNLHETFRIQTEEVARYDLTVSCPGGMTIESREKLEEVLSSCGAECAGAWQGGAIARTEGETFGCTMLCMERDTISDYFGVAVPQERGITLSYNLSAAYHLKSGDSISLYSRWLNLADVPVEDVFEYHIGNLMVLPAETYESLFGVSCEPNSYLVHCSSPRREMLVKALQAYNAEGEDKVSFETVEASMEQFRSIGRLYDLLVGVIILLVAAMNMLILIHLTHILISRRMTDLNIMRMNGFSLRQIRNYLFRETAFTTVPGILLGIASGVPFALFVLRRISTMKITLVVRTEWMAWMIAAILCAGLSLAVFHLSFLKVRRNDPAAPPQQ